MVLSLAFGDADIVPKRTSAGTRKLKLSTLAAKTRTWLLRGEVDDEVCAYGDGFSVTQAGGENPCGDDLNGLLLEIVSPGGEHGGLIDMAIFADDGVHRDVIPRAGTRRGQLRRGLNEGAAVLLAGAKGLRIGRG